MRLNKISNSVLLEEIKTSKHNKNYMVLYHNYKNQHCNQFDDKNHKN